MRGTSNTRWAVGTLAVVAIALSFDALRRTRADFDAMRAPPMAIRGQLDAFNRDDYRAAYRYAALEIQERYPLADFRHMVQEGFPQIAHSRVYSIGPSDLRGDEAVVPVSVTGKDGVSLRVVYWLRHERTGWRVAGVEPDHVAAARPSRVKRDPAEHARQPRESSVADRIGNHEVSGVPN